MDLNRKKVLVFTITAIVWVLLDQWSKYKVRTTDSLQNLELIPGWLSFHYTKNPGMALGIDIIDTFYISLFALIATVLIIVYVIRSIQIATVPFMFLMGLIIGGAVGNIIDRMTMGYVFGYGGFLEGHVVDFIHFTLRIGNTPVFPYIFNVADIGISVAVVLFIVFNKKFIPPDIKSVDEVDSGDKSVPTGKAKAVGKGKTADYADTPGGVEEENTLENVDSVAGTMNVHKVDDEVTTDQYSDTKAKNVDSK